MSKPTKKLLRHKTKTTFRKELAGNLVQSNDVHTGQMCFSGQRPHNVV